MFRTQNSTSWKTRKSNPNLLPWLSKENSHWAWKRKIRYSSCWTSWRKIVPYDSEKYWCQQKMDLQLNQYSHFWIHQIEWPNCFSQTTKLFRYSAHRWKIRARERNGRRKISWPCTTLSQAQRQNEKRIGGDFVHRLFNPRYPFFYLLIIRK